MPEITLFGEVGTDITAKGVADSLKAMGRAREITVRLASAGGSVTEGVSVLNLLRNHPAKIHVAIEGHVLSMGSVIAMAGDTVSIASNALVMAHEPWTTITGNSTELRKTAGVMDKMAEAIIGAYVRKTGKSAEVIQAMMAAETWFDADEALAYGLADSIEAADDSELIAASFDTSKFNIPDRLKGKIAMTTQTKNEVTAADKTAILAAEKQRRTEIRNVFDFHGDDYSKLRDRCLDDVDCSTARARELLLEAVGRGRGPLGAGNQHTITASADQLADFKAAATDALLAREGIKVAEPHPGAQDLSRMSLTDMAAVFVKKTGRSVRGMNASQIVAAAITHSTSDFSLLLEDTANKAVRAGTENASASHLQWVDIKDIPNFKTVSRVGLGSAPDLLPVLENGEITHGTFAEEAEKYSLDSYAHLFTVSRKAIINDDLSAFVTLPNAFAAAAVRKQGDLVYSVLTSNGNMSDGNALFSAAHSNIGTTAALSVDSLAEARKMMRRQKTVGDTGLINALPRFLIVPAALETAGEVLIASLMKPGETNAVNNAEWVRNLELVVDPRLDDVSETGWYLAADARTVGTVELGRLAGEPVSIETMPGFEIDGVSIKCRLDAGAAAVDWRGMVYNAGA